MPIYDFTSLINSREFITYQGIELSKKITIEFNIDDSDGVISLNPSCYDNASETRYSLSIIRCVLSNIIRSYTIRSYKFPHATTTVKGGDPSKYLRNEFKGQMVVTAMDSSFVRTFKGAISRRIALAMSEESRQMIGVRL